MSKTDKIVNLERKKQLSTLELWQAHLKALKNASRERHNLAKKSEMTISESTERPSH